LVILGTFGVAAWVAFIKYANNQERLTSSITQQILQNLRDSPEVSELLGDAIRPEPVWYLNGDPWVDGVVSSCPYTLSLV
jgi:cytochrome c oxidase assembly factor 1